MTQSTTEIARTAIIAEQNSLIAASYCALLAARDYGIVPREVTAAIESIELWRQKRDPGQPERINDMKSPPRR